MYSQDVEKAEILLWKVSFPFPQGPFCQDQKHLLPICSLTCYSKSSRNTKNKNSQKFKFFWVSLCPPPPVCFLFSLSGFPSIVATTEYMSVVCVTVVGGSNFPRVSWPAGKLSTFPALERTHLIRTHCLKSSSFHSFCSIFNFLTFDRKGN